MKKSIYKGLVGSIICVCFLTNLGFIPVSAVEQIKIWWSQPDLRPVLQAHIENYEKSHPNVKISVLQIGWHDSPRKILVSIAAGQDKVLPDMVNLFCDMPFQFAPLAQTVKIDDLWPEEATRIKEDIFPRLLNTQLYNGKLIALPHCLEGYGILYNEDKFEEAGIKEYPKSWDEMVVLAKKFTKDLDGDGKIDQWGVNACPWKGPDGSYWWMYYMYMCNGGKIVSEDGRRIVFNNSFAKEATQYMVDLTWKYEVSPPVGLEEEVPLFVKQVVMSYSQMVTLLRGQKRVKFKIQAFPTPTFGGRPGGITTFQSYMMLDRGLGRGHLNSAWDFVKFFTFSKKYMIGIAEIKLFMPPYKSLSATKEWTKFTAEHPEYHPFTDNLPNCYTLQGMLGGSRIYNRIAKAVHNAWWRKETPDRAIENAAKDCQVILDEEYKRK